MIALLALSAQGDRPKSVRELERQVRIAKGDVGRQWRAEAAPPRLRAADAIFVEAVDADAHGRSVGA
jgi:hypothetical protein